MAYRWVIDQEYPQGHLVEMTPEEDAQRQADEADAIADAAAEAERVAKILALAAKIEDGSATAVQQRKALAACVRQLLISEAS